MSQKTNNPTDLEIELDTWLDEMLELDINAITKPTFKKACECGAEVAKTTHAAWCTLFKPSK